MCFLLQKTCFNYFVSLKRAVPDYIQVLKSQFQQSQSQLIIIIIIIISIFIPKKKTHYNDYNLVIQIIGKGRPETFARSSWPPVQLSKIKKNLDLHKRLGYIQYKQFVHSKV